ncbi:replicase [Potexvirus ecsallii]|uniref:RNA replication protein n=1 Tax=Potexvirus ecsallii TaxID=317027 RepID=C0L9E1_9VIRU|nr:replicase [Allium virus X]ACN58194.1 replicase [Allium virus X]
MARVREALSNFTDPAVKVVLQNDHYQEFKKTMARTKLSNPYALKETEADTLENLEILSNPFAIETHTHAAAKAIENDLYFVASHQLPAEPITFLFMKRNKLAQFRRGPQQGDIFLNKIVEPKDIARYPEDTLIDSLHVNTEVAFMGDTLHFLSFHFLGRLFHLNKNLQTLVATMVLPAEAKYRMASLHPNVYTLSYFGEHNFIYAPGGHHGAEYVHDFKQLDWLRVGRVRYKNQIITAQRIESKAANHLFVFQRGNLNTPPLRGFGTCKKYVTLPRIFLPKKFNTRVPIEKTLVMQIFTYVKGVAKVTERDIYAKVRQLIKTDQLQGFDASELVHIVNYFCFIAKQDSMTCFSDILSGSLFKKLFQPLAAFLAECKHFIFGEPDFKKLLKALQWQDITMVVTVADINLDSQLHDIAMNGFQALGPDVSTPERQMLPGEDDDRFAEHYPDILGFLLGKRDLLSYKPQTLQLSHPHKFLHSRNWRRRGWNNKGLSIFSKLHDANQPPKNQKTSPSTPPCLSLSKRPRPPHSQMTTWETMQNTRIRYPSPHALLHHNTKTLVLSDNSSEHGSNPFGQLHARLREPVAPIPTPPPTPTSTHEPHNSECQNPGCILDTLSVDESFVELLESLPFQHADKIRTRRAFFFCTQPWGYGHDAIHYRTFKMPLFLSNFIQEHSLDVNSALVQCFTLNARIPFHKDDELCYSLVHPVHCVSTGLAKLELKRADQRSMSYHLQGPCSYTLPGNSQQAWRHAVTALSQNRISVTFRKQLKPVFNTSFSTLRLLEPFMEQEAATYRTASPAPIQSDCMTGIASSGEPTSVHSTPDLEFATLSDTTSEGNSHEADSTDGTETSVRDASGFHVAPPPENPAPPLPWEQWIPKLNALGFSGLARISDPQDKDQLICPITCIKSGFGIFLPEDTDTKPFTDLLTTMHRMPCAYKVNNSRAKAYASDVENSRTGLLLRSQPDHWKEALTMQAETADHTIALSVIHGAGGSGKSHALQQLIRENPELNFLVVCPTNELRLDWLAKLPKVELHRIKTFEKALADSTAATIIFGDYSKLPAGYIECYLAARPTATLAILTGDPRQSSYHESNEGAMISQLAPSTSEFGQYCRYYINATHRNKQDLARMLGVYSERTGLTSISMSSRPLTDTHLLVPSIIKKRTYMELGYKTSTYAGCQGITAPRLQILLDCDTTLCADEVLYTALSRAVHGIHFINTGATSGAFWDKLNATPYLKTFLDFTREERLKESQPREQEPTEPEGPTTHFPVENEKFVLEEQVEELLEKHDREILRPDHGHTNCVQTEDAVIQLFSHQQAKDQALLWATIEARLKISNPKANIAEFNAKKEIGDVLFEHYHQAMKLPDKPIPFMEDLWVACAQEVQGTYLSKPINMLKNGEYRQSPDFDKNTIALFLKSQWVKKMEKLGAPKIKPGQTIASFQQSAVMLYGTMARYMRRMREAFQPPEIMINCEKDPQTLSHWIQNYWKFNSYAYANDFTQFDQSQDGAMLQFEILKAKHHSIPEWVLEGYLDIKTNAKVFSGVLSIMRLTGEGPTFDANTECNIAYTHLRFDVPKGTAQLYAGDDSALSCLPPERPSFADFKQQLTLTSKPALFAQKRGFWAEFCGYLITPLGIMKDPAKLAATVVLAQKQNKLHECWRSHALDLKLAYVHRDALTEVLSEKQQELHQLTVRTLVKSGASEILDS